MAPSEVSKEIFAKLMVDPTTAKAHAENRRALHEECVIAWDALTVEQIAVEINDWLFEHPGWRVKHQSLTSYTYNEGEGVVYAALITMEKGRA